MIATTIQAVQFPTTTLRFRWKTPTTVNALHRTLSYNRRSGNEGETRIKVLELLKSELLNDPIFEWTNYSRQWVDQMIDYSVPRGKLLRSNALIECYTSLKQGEDISEDQLFLATVLGWCIEWFQASFLIHDDIMDNSDTRRGQACWYRVPKVGNIAINDAVVLQYQVPRILSKHFGTKPYYMDLLNLFNEVVYRTVLGEMMDLITTVEGEKNLFNYSWTVHRLISLNKASYYTFYLPVACALILAGQNLDEHANLKDLLFDMGDYFQILDDYQDCFGDSKISGKNENQDCCGDPKMSGMMGTDIESSKCSWLVLKAMELCNEEQRNILLEHYGKGNPSDVAKVKGVYNEVGVQGICETYLRNTYHQLQTRIEAHPSKLVHTIWEVYTPYLTSGFEAFSTNTHM